MSIQNAIEFMMLARRDSALQRRLTALRGPEAIAALVEIAAESGYVFTDAEYRAAVIADSQGELSEESIEEVSRELGL